MNSLLAAGPIVNGPTTKGSYANANVTIADCGDSALVAKAVGLAAGVEITSLDKVLSGRG